MRQKKIKLTSLPTAYKVLIVICTIILAFLIGSMIGFGVLGDGNPFSIFDSATWKHIFSYFTKGKVVK
ncbi:DNA-directed RNA polymerase subunit beta [Carnobacterium gallinarum]|uniref:DNA-directed RNA polymerase subunit beta n=1 Tax=Carnobacterium gallinarum TaxID=2749 RepID=UPI00054CFDDD|nr:DNA-directed RNA polymerase subunit beta [Carnobacterium gallinarum]